jgi:deazaflavin-dependent oxidoreductase (nitroreductase family)
MPQKIKELSLPGGISRWLFRLPIHLYHMHFGGLLGDRFVLLTHIGRKSGLPRQTVLEIVRYLPADHSCIVASGWGEKSAWFQNISLNPKITYQIRNQARPGVAERLNPAAASAELLDYGQRHPAALRELGKFMGYAFDGTEADIAALGQVIPMFHFKPIQADPQAGPAQAT